jgi:hypothetical protein
LKNSADSITWQGLEQEGELQSSKGLGKRPICEDNKVKNSTVFSQVTQKSMTT